MGEWTGSDPEEIIDRLGQANEALVGKVREANGATSAARTNERYYRALFDAIDDGYCVIEVLFNAQDHPFDYRFTEVNPAFRSHTGLGDVAGRTMRELRPGHEQHWFDIYGEVARTGRPVHFTEHAEQLDDRWFRVSAFPLGEEAPFLVGTVFRDITAERAEVEHRRVLGEHQAFLLRLGDTVRSLTDIDEVLATSLALLRDHLGLSRCGYGEVDREEVVTIAHDDRDHDMPPMTGTRRMADYDPDIMDAFRRGRTLTVHDVETDPRMAAPEVAAVCAKAGIGATLEAPLMRGDRLCAILFAHQREARRWTQDEVALVQDVAERTWAMVESARGAEILRVNEARTAFLLELTDTLRPLDEPADISFATAAALGRHLGVARCLYGEFDAAGKRFTVDRDWTNGTVDHLSEPVDVSEFGDYTAPLRRGSTVVIDDAAADARTDHAGHAFERIGPVRSTVMVPMVRAGSLTAAFAVQDTEPREWGADEIALVEEVADRTWSSTQRAHDRQALEESRARAEIALEAAEMGSFVWYPEEDRAALDERLRKLYGLGSTDPAMSLGRALGSLIHPDDRARFRAAAARAADTEGDGRLLEEIRIVRPDGGERAIAVRGQTDFRKAGRPPRMHGVVIDLTAQRRAERQEREERGERERRDREFVSNAAHELRTPLAGILAAMDALDAGAASEPDERRRFLGHIRTAGERMSRLSDSLLLLARPDGPPPTERADVGRMLGDVAASLLPGEDVQVDVRAPSSVMVATNPGLLERVLTNLAENAVAHTDRGRIELRAVASEGAVDVTVTNTGASVDPAVAKRAFDRFYRGPGGEGGFGLGLAIAAQAASAIGGELTLAPANGSGTVAHLRLPVDGHVSPR